MLGELTQKDLASALDAAAAEALAAAGYQEGAVDCLLLAKRLRLAVVWDHTLLGRARFVRLHQPAESTPQGSILLRPDPRRERLQWAVAHEIGEHLAHRVFGQLGVSPQEAPAGMRERVANWLAGRILLPSEAFLNAALACDWDLPALKQMFATASHELIARRMFDFEIPVAITLLDHGCVTFRRGNFAGQTPPLLPLERRLQLAAHESGQATAGDDGLLFVKAWPIHEPDWKREILRTAWPDGCDEPADGEAFC
jgi:hypothetical protein